MFITLRIIGCAVFVLTFFHTGVTQLIVVRLTIKKAIIFIDCYFLFNGIVVGTIVGDVQLTIAVNQRQVTIAIQTTSVIGTQRDEVAVIDIIDGSSSIAKHRRCIGIGSRRTCRRVTTGKHRIMDNDTEIIQLAPYRCISSVLGTQMIEVCCRNILFG